MLYYQNPFRFWISGWFIQLWSLIKNESSAFIIVLNKIIKIEILPTATLRQAKSNGKVESFRASWIADYPDAENYLSLFSSTNHSPFGPNYTHFKNQLFDSLYDKSFETINLKNNWFSNWLINWSIN